jgi:glucose/mannose transport system substrate-binding protein
MPANIGYSYANLCGVRRIGALRPTSLFRMLNACRTRYGTPDIRRRTVARSQCRRALTAAVMAIATAAQAQDMRVLHWWTSNSERMASGTIAAAARRAGIGWIDEDASDGVGAAIVLRSRLLAHDMPDVAQANSLASLNWARLGLVRDLDRTADANDWKRRLLPAVYRLIRPAGQVTSAPLGVHRMNTLLYNRHVFARLGLAPPRTWADFERIAPLLRRAGIVPLAQSSESWQVSVLFENVLLADGGVALHKRLFTDDDAQAFSEPAFAQALLHLRRLKRWMRTTVPEAHWSDIAREVNSGTAAMLVGGDWFKGELLAFGAQVDRTIGCSPAPGTASIHLYDLDTLVMLHSDRVPRAAQEKIARIAVDPALQERYNRIKGSATVLRDADPALMDSCARASWTMLADPAATLVPSIAIGMIGDDVMRDALASELYRFFMDDSVTVQDTQRRLAAVSRAFSHSQNP